MGLSRMTWLREELPKVNPAIIYLESQHPLPIKDLSRTYDAARGLLHHLPGQYAEYLERSLEDAVRWKETEDAVDEGVAWATEQSRAAEKSMRQFLSVIASGAKV